jgi:hypothetical protein
LGDPEPLSHPLAIGLDSLGGCAGEPHEFEGLVDAIDAPVLGPGAGHAVEVRAAGEIGPQTRLLNQRSHPRQDAGG